MTDIHTQIRDNVERLEKEIQERNLVHRKKGEKLGIILDDNGWNDTIELEAELKTTIAENIKWADAMIEELELFKASLHWYIRPSGKAERDIEHISTKIKKWQETKQWLEERQ